MHDHHKPNKQEPQTATPHTPKFSSFVFPMECGNKSKNNLKAALLIFCTNKGTRIGQRKEEGSEEFLRKKHKTHQRTP
jgi:hypothetical protein